MDGHDDSIKHVQLSSHMTSIHFYILDYHFLPAIKPICWNIKYMVSINSAKRRTYETMCEWPVSTCSVGDRDLASVDEWDDYATSIQSSSFLIRDRPLSVMRTNNMSTCMGKSGLRRSLSGTGQELSEKAHHVCLELERGQGAVIIPCRY